MLPPGKVPFWSVRAISHRLGAALKHYIRLTSQYRLVLGPGLAAFGEELLLRLWIEAVIDHAGEIAQAGGEAGFQVPGVDQGAALAFANEGTGALEAIQLALDGIQRYGKVAGDGSPVGFPMVEKRQKHRFRCLSAKQILERR